ncbi:MAG: hypothetical protein R8N23_01250 [Reichenbachiella sp.]|uniref:hypothetical protein n=1 Tax=Reichenbachiella sp. TaxID=2184521 RepID=UPI002966D233|nr:hypothetical protein [Reichenbachiella sp.]MDW3208463.1 hypothetical protein [Reichenbachiella sp.]
MKHLRKTLSVLLIGSCLCGHAQTVRIVDNNYNAPTGNLIYSTIQDAVDAADAGDLIYIQPSPTTYGDATITKELHIKGIGYNLDKDLPFHSRMGTLLFWNNTDNTSNSSNSTLTGVTLVTIRIGHGSGGSYTSTGIKINNCILTGGYSITSDVYCGSCEVPIADLEIYDCDIRGAIHIHREVSNLLLRNNLIRNNVILDSPTAQSAIITNNIIYGVIRKDSQGDGLMIVNNNFLGANGSDAAFSSSMIDATISFNIFYGRTPSLTAAGGSTSDNFQRNIFSYNLTYETGNDELPPSGGSSGNSNTGLGNVEGQSPLFLNAPVLNSWDSSRDFTLDSGSPATNIDGNGNHCGISDGSYPFNGSNFTYDTSPMPTIQILNTEAVINPGDDLDVEISIKAN